MTLGKNLVIVDENRVDIKYLHKFFKKSVYEHDFVSTYSKLKNTKLYVMIQGEEIYTKVITIPKVKKNSIFNIVRTELSCYFKNVDDVLFTYKIIKKTKNEYKLLILYINSSQVDFIKRNESILVKKITPVQILVGKYFEKKIDCDNYIIVFNYNRYCYFTLYLQNNIAASYVEKEESEFEDKTYVDKFYRFFEKYCENVDNIDKVYFVNLKYKNVIMEIGKKHVCVNLGCIQRNQLISLCG